jgi:protein-S-isoprenylcysteine O-methyltransferase Ste14
MSRIPSLGPRGEGWVVLQLLALALVALAGRLAPRVLSADPVTRSLVLAVGWALLVTGAVLAMSAYLALKGAASFSILPRPAGGGHSVASGPYRIVRHPLYAGLILGGVGFAVIRESPASLVAAIGLFVVLDLKRRREEAWLAERFPEYAGYRTRTRGLIPFIY